MTGERETVDDRLNFSIREIFRVCVVVVQQFGGEVVVTMVTLRGSELSAVPPVRHHLFGDIGLLVRGWFTPGEGLAIAAPILQAFVVGLWETNEPKHGLTRQRKREGVDEFCSRSVCNHCVHKLVAAPTDVLLQRFEPPATEALSGVSADAAVVGIGQIRHDCNRVEIGCGEHGFGFVAERKHGVLHIG